MNTKFIFLRVLSNKQRVWDEEFVLSVNNIHPHGKLICVLVIRLLYVYV